MAHAEADDPPPLRTERHQFTQLDPSPLLPSVALLDLGGAPARIPRVPGRVLLVNLWATWCPACRTDLALFAAARVAIGDHVAFAAVSTDTVPPAAVARYVGHLSLSPLPILIDPDGRLAGRHGDAAAPLPLLGTPMTYVVTPFGRIAGYILGVVDWLTAEAQALLGYYAG